MYKWHIFVRDQYIGSLICTQAAIEEYLQGKFLYTVQEIGHRIDISQEV